MGDGNFKTSYVTVNRPICRQERKPRIYFKTSYVTVNLISSFFSSCGKSEFQNILCYG